MAGTAISGFRALGRSRKWLGGVKDRIVSPHPPWLAQPRPFDFTRFSPIPRKISRGFF